MLNPRGQQILVEEYIEYPYPGDVALIRLDKRGFLQFWIKKEEDIRKFFPFLNQMQNWVRPEGQTSYVYNQFYPLDVALTQGDEAFRENLLRLLAVQLGLQKLVQVGTGLLIGIDNSQKFHFFAQNDSKPSVLKNWSTEPMTQLKSFFACQQFPSAQNIKDILSTGNAPKISSDPSLIQKLRELDPSLAPEQPGPNVRNRLQESDGKANPSLFGVPYPDWKQPSADGKMQPSTDRKMPPPTQPQQTLSQASQSLFASEVPSEHRTIIENALRTGELKLDSFKVDSKQESEIQTRIHGNLNLERQKQIFATFLKMTKADPRYKALKITGANEIMDSYAQSRVENYSMARSINPDTAKIDLSDGNKEFQDKILKKLSDLRKTEGNRQIIEISKNPSNDNLKFKEVIQNYLAYLQGNVWGLDQQGINQLRADMANTPWKKYCNELDAVRDCFSLQSPGQTPQSRR